MKEYSFNRWNRRGISIGTEVLSVFVEADICAPCAKPNVEVAVVDLIADVRDEYDSCLIVYTRDYSRCLRRCS